MSETLAVDTSQKQSLSHQSQQKNFKDQNNYIAKIQSKEQQCFKIATQMKNYTSDLKELMNIIPHSSSIKGTDADSSKMRTTYTKFAEQASLVDEQFNKLHSLLGQYKVISDNIASIADNIRKKVGTRIEYNKIIDSKEIKKSFQLQIDETEQQYKEILKQFKQIKKNLDDLNVTKIKNEISACTRKIQTDLFQQNALAQYEKEKNEINDYEIEEAKLESQIDFIRSELELINNQFNQCQEATQDLKKQQDEMETKNNGQIKQLEELKSQKVTDNSKLLDWINEQINSCNSEKQKQMDKFIEQQNKLMKVSQKALETAQSSLQSASFGSQNSSYIVLLDESGSMEGETFEQCTKAIKQLVQNLNEDDEFCLIQFDDSARITVNKKEVKLIDIDEIGKNFKGGGTNFNEAFTTLKDVIPLCEDKNKINIIFFTDGQDSSDSYLETLEQINDEFSQYDMTLFCLGYGSNIDSSSLKSCLSTFNGNEIYKQVNYKLNIQTLYQVESVGDIIDTFKKLIQSNLIEKQEIEQKMTLQKQQTEYYDKEFDKQKNQILQIFDDKLSKLEKQKKKAVGSFKNSDIDKNIQALKEIQKSEADILQTKIQDLENKLIEINKNKGQKEGEMNQALKKVEQLKNKIETKNKLINDNQQKEFTELFIEQKQERENQIKSYGFENIHHYQQFIGKVSASEDLSHQIQNFINSIQQSIKSSYYFLDSILNSIKDIEDEQEDEITEKEIYIRKYISQNYLSQQKDCQNVQLLQTNTIIEEFILMIDTSLSIQIQENPQDQDFFTKIVPYFSSFVEILNLGNDLIKKKKEKGKQQQKVLSIEEYADHIFFKFYGLKDIAESQAQLDIDKLEEKIAQLEEKIEDEENSEKQKRMEEQLEKLQEKLDDKRDKLEDKLERQESKQKKQLKKDYKRQFDIILRIISNLHSTLKQIEHQIKQRFIFSPIQTLSSNIKDMIESNDNIQVLCITN